MKGFGKIAILFGLLGGVMAYFIIPVQFTRSRALSPTDKAEYVWTVSNYRKYCGAYAGEWGAEDIWAGLDAMLQHRRQVIGDRLTWCRLIGALWLNR
jgi:hypothetical protein